MCDCSGLLAQEYARTGGEKIAHKRLFQNRDPCFYRRASFPRRHISYPQIQMSVGFLTVLAAG